MDGIRERGSVVRASGSRGTVRAWSRFDARPVGVGVLRFPGLNTRGRGQWRSRSAPERRRGGGTGSARGGSAMDAAVSPATAIEIGKLGGLACLNLEGLWTRYEDPEPIYEEIASLTDEKATGRMQELYKEPVKDELVGRRIQEIKQGGVVVCASLTPQRVERYAKSVIEAGLDVLVIQGTVVSAEHVSTRTEPLNLKEFIATYDLPVIVGGCASFSTALHLMRTGAVGVLVGVGPGNACTTI